MVEISKEVYRNRCDKKEQGRGLVNHAQDITPSRGSVHRLAVYREEMKSVNITEKCIP